MRLLDRYLLRELLVPLGYCLSGFLLLWVVSDLLTELDGFQTHKVSALAIGHYYLVKAPEFLVVIFPIGLLLALLYALTNHARHNEITAIRAAGVGLWRLCLPYLAVGLVSSLALFALNEFYVPDSNERAEQIRNPVPADAPSRRQIQNQGFHNPRDHRLWHFGLYDKITGEMLNPVVVCQEPDGARLSLYADRAALTNGVWTFYVAREYREVPATGVLPVLLLKTNVLAEPEFSETPEQINSEMRISASMNSLSLRGMKKADVPITELINYLRLHPNPSRSESSWLYTKLHGRLATPWTCLVVVLIAVPFGAATGRRNVFVGVASSILICFAYFVVQQFCLALGTGGYVPPWLGGWFPNAAFGLAGLWLTAKVR
jgi:lipopolysaccharide export system permease protein